MRTVERILEMTLPPMTEKDFEMARVANFLNVSRPFVIKEIKAGKLKHRIVGTHRRIVFEDVIAYARQMRPRQVGALDKLAANAQELGLDLLTRAATYDSGRRLADEHGDQGTFCWQG